MTAATLTRPMPGDPTRCVYLTRRGQCQRTGRATVPGVRDLLCKQHARIVATEPGAAGVVRRAPEGVEEIVADLDAATTVADYERCRSAIRAQMDDCQDHLVGIKPILRLALQRAKARLAHGSRP